jgi:serine/threonine protein kinase
VTPERWQLIEDAFSVGVELPGSELPQFLETLPDPEVRREVATLIESATGAGQMLRDVVAAEAAHLGAAQNSALLGRRIGAYRLLELLGEGGMGTVYAAERADDQYSARVAVKVLRSLDGPAAVARFRDERQILASLEHPGIVRLLDGGRSDEGLHYLVMERIEGIPITRYAREHELTVRERVELLRQVCGAVQYAHGKLVVHRDLKPSNILVDGNGVPRLLDFGIAKLIDAGSGEREAFTMTGAALMTPAYASPEQARGEQVTTATDVYSFGAVLYELLAEQPPHQPAGIDTLRVICEVEPPRPSAVAPPERRRLLAGDLDNIIGMALNKDPARRYASIAQLDDDLGRYLDGLPVIARTPTLGYRTRKFVRRNRGKLAIALLVATALATSAVYSAQQARRADEQSQRAERRFQDLRKLADTLVFKIDDKVRDLKGSTAVRELVVSSALEYLDRLASDATADRDLELDLARAYMKVGDVQGNMSYSNLGRPADALVSYGKAQAIITRLLAEDPAHLATQKAFASMELGSGLVEITRGEKDTGLRLILDGIHRSDELPAGSQLDPERLSRGYYYVVSFELDPHRTREHLAAARRIAERWQASDPSPDAAYWVGITHAMAAQTAGNQGDPETAVREFQQAADIFAALARDHHDDNRFERDMEISHVHLAMYAAGVGGAEMWQPETGDLAAAEASMRKVIEPYAALAARDPEDAQIVTDYPAIVASLAAIIARRDPAASLPVFDQALAVYGRMPAMLRQSRTNEQSEWFVHCSLAEVLGKLGRRDPANEEGRLGLAMAARVGEDNHSNETLEMCRAAVARGRRALGDRAGALELLDAARATLESRITPASTAIIDRIGYVDILDQLAELRPEQRCDLQARAAAAWRSWPGEPSAYTQRRGTELEAVVTACQH